MPSSRFNKIHNYENFHISVWTFFFIILGKIRYAFDSWLLEKRNVLLSKLFLGPAGTGKTESVKALGNQLGRFVLVFNCDETFDFQAMGRIFVGLCQVGAWGCFDEFNRLEERMLSAVSQQVQTIQEALKSQREASADGASVGSE